MRSSPLYIALAIALAAGGLLPTAPAAAQTASAVRATAQSTMVLTGTIGITRDGSVDALQIDQADTISPAIASFVDGAVRGWHFKPVMVDGQQVAAKAPLRLRLQARPMPDGSAEVAIRDADFSRSDASTDSVTRLKLQPPSFPDEVFRMGGRGTALVLLKIDRRGTVADAVVEQVNLTVAGPEPAMVKIRRLLASSTLSAARRWTFTPPTTGPDKDRDFWVVRVPVYYAGLRESAKEKYGQWSAYIPGPKQVAPWRKDTAAGSDLLPAGGVYMVDSSRKGPELLTPLEQG